MSLIGSNFKSHNKRLLTTLLVLLALLLVACGGDSNNGAAEDNEPEATNNTANNNEAMNDEAMDDEAMDDEAMDDEAMDDFNGVMRVAMEPLVNIDPLFISSDAEVLVANHVYDYLVDVDAGSNPTPRLATGWSVSDDGLTWTFTLAEGVTWHDGSEFTSQDVVWTFERLRDTEGTPTADLYANIANIEATADLEVVFTLTDPNPFFLYDLSDNHALVLQEGTEDADTNFNGTGPFIVETYSPEDRIELVANPNYFVEGQPNLAGVTIIFFSDNAAAVDALRGGQVDLVMRMSIAQFQTLQGEPGIVTIDIPTNGFDLIRLRSDREPGNDPRIIEAMRLALDREIIFEVVQQGYGAIGNDSPIGPLYDSYHDPSAQPPGRDVDAAIALLADAGYPDGIDLVLHVPDSGGRPDLAQVLAAQWGEAGIRVELSVEPESVYYGDDGWLEVDLGITGWGSRPYPQFYLDVMLVTGAKWNESHFADEEFDRLATIAGTTLDEDERIQAYADIQALLVDRGPVIIPYFFAQVAGISDQYDNFELKAFAGRTDFRGVVYTGN